MPLDLKMGARSEEWNRILEKDIDDEKTQSPRKKLSSQEEENPGLFVGFNADDDNRNNVQDRKEGIVDDVTAFGTTFKEDDLQKMELRVTNAREENIVYLDIRPAMRAGGWGDSGRVKIWRDRKKSGAVIMDMTKIDPLKIQGSGQTGINVADMTNDPDQANVRHIYFWAEGVELSGWPRDVVLMAGKTNKPFGVYPYNVADTVRMTVIGPTAQGKRDQAVASRTEYGCAVQPDENLVSAPHSIQNRTDLPKLHAYVYSPVDSTYGGDEDDVCVELFSYDGGRYWQGGESGNFSGVVESFLVSSQGNVLPYRIIGVDQNFITNESAGYYIVADKRLHIDGNVDSVSTVVGAGEGRLITRFFKDLLPSAGIRPPGWMINVFEVNMAAELNGNPPVDVNDEMLKRTMGAVVVLNEDDDNRNTHKDVEDGRLAANGAIPRSIDENDLKKITFKPLPASLNKGQVVMRRSNGNIRVYSDPKKGIATDNDKAILWSATPGAFSSAIEGNGKKTWNLAVAADKAALTAIVASGIYVEGTQTSGAKRDTDFVFELVPTDATVPAYEDTIKFTVVPLVMDFITNLEDVGVMFATDRINKIQNPAVIVIELAPDAANVARLILKSSPFIGENDDFVEWNIVAEDGNARFFVEGDGEDRTGTLARVYGVTNGRLRIEAKVKAAEHPYIVYRPLVAPELTVPYRCNFLVSTEGFRNSISRSRIPDIMAIANRILRQVGVKLVPDPNITTNVFPSTIVADVIPVNAQSVKIPDATQYFCQYARLRITHGDITTTVLVNDVISITDQVVFTSPIGVEFPAGATITWDINPQDIIPSVDGCRELPNLPTQFLNTDENTVFYASILNNRDGVINFNFVNTHPNQMVLAEMQTSSANIFAKESTRVKFIDFCENDERYIMDLLPAPLSQNDAVKKAGTSVIVTSSIDMSLDALVSIVLAHEAGHGFALRHRGLASQDDLVAMGQNIPVISPVVGKGADEQNIMPDRNVIGLDLDVLQSIVARGSSLFLTNSGHLQVTPETTTLDLITGQSKSDFRFAVTRFGIPVSNAKVEFYLRGTTSIEILSSGAVVTDANGTATISFRAMGSPGDVASILAIVTEGNDTTSASVSVTLTAPQ